MVWLAALMGLAGEASVSYGQMLPFRTPRVRTVLQDAREAHTRGDYELAGRLYQRVQVQRKKLNATEQKDLVNLIRQNNIALQAQRKGREQIKQANDALKRGFVSKANVLFNTASSNQYLSPMDKKLLAQLKEQIRSGELPAGNKEPWLQTKKENTGQNYKDLLIQARQALKRGDHQTAESLARQAEKVNTALLPSWVQWWNDSPAKVLRDVAAAKTKTSPPPKQVAENQQSKKRTTIGQRMRNLLPWRSNSSPTQKPTTTKRKKIIQGTPGRTENNTLARKYVQQGYQALQQNDLKAAMNHALKAKALNPQLASWERSPDRLMKDIQDRQAAVVKTAYQNNPSIPKVPSKKSDSKTEKARHLIKEGFQALNNRDLPRAREMALKAKALRPSLEWWEDNPEKLLKDVDRISKALNKQNGNPLLPPKTPVVNSQDKKDAKALLRKGRELLSQGKLDEAEKIAKQAALAPNSGFGLFQDSAGKLRNDIASARKRRNRDKAVKMLAQARELFQQKRFQEAKDLTYKAEKLHDFSGILELGDRPDRLRSEIVAAELAQRKPNIPMPPGGENLDTPPPPPPVAKKQTTPNVPTPMPTPAGTNRNTQQLLAKQKVLSLMAEARALQQQNRLIQARAKAMEAKNAAVYAQKLGIFFTPNEDSPHLILPELNGQASKRVQDLLNQVDNITKNQANPNRYQVANTMLQEAKDLVTAFGFPTRTINQKMAWLQQQEQPNRAGPKGIPLPPAPSLTKKKNAFPTPGINRDVNMGKMLIQNATRELRAGQTILARKIAEEASDPKYGVQDEAFALLRMIGAEEFQQMVLSATRTAHSVRDFYIQGQFQKAMDLAQSIDMNLLNPKDRADLREIMTSPQMRGGSMFADKTKTTDPAPFSPDLNPVPNTKPGFADRYKAMEEILFMKLRKESISEQNLARNEFRDGDRESAVHRLKALEERISNSNLAAEKINVLQAQVRRRLQQFKTLINQDNFKKEQLAARKGAIPREGLRQIKKQQRDTEVANLIKQFQALYREGKFNEAHMVALQAKDIDPDNVAVDISLQMSMISKNLEIHRKSKNEQADFRIGALNAKFGKYVDAGPGETPITIDPLISQRSKKRANGLRGYSFRTISAREQEIERKLLSPINLNFKDVPLGQAIEDLNYLSGINIVPDTASLQRRGISLEQPLSLKVENIPLKSALNILLDKVGLTHVVKDDVLQITTQEDARGKLVQKTYPVGDLVVPVPNSSAPPMLNLGQLMDKYRNPPQGFAGPRPYTPGYTLPNGQPIGSPGGGYSPGGGQGFGANYNAQNNFPGSPGGVSAWNKGTPTGTIEDQLIGLVTSTIAPDSWAEVGGKGTIQYFPLGMGLVVNQTQDVQEQVADLLEALRRLQDLEVAIEIRLISVSETFFEFIGMDFDVNFTTDQGRFEPQLVGQSFQPFGFVNRFLPDGFVSGVTPAGTFTPDLNIPLRSSSFNHIIPQIGGFPGTLGADGGLSLGLAFLSDIQVFMFLEAAQGDRRANTMQAPRVTVFNGQLATLAVFDSQPFITNISPAFAGDGQLFFIPVQIPIPVGTNIFVQPVVSADRRFVRMSINTNMQNLISANNPITVQVPLIPSLLFGPNNSVVGGEPAQLFQIVLQQPVVSTINVQTTVAVPDGGTVLLGGLKALSEERSEFGPPILSKIPYISRLFRNVGYGRATNSLMMMVTPRIIINEEEELIFLEQLPPIPR